MSSPTFRKRSKSTETSPVKRSRSGSRVKLEELYRLLDKTILDYQVGAQTHDFLYKHTQGFASIYYTILFPAPCNWPPPRIPLC